MKCKVLKNDLLTAMKNVCLITPKNSKDGVILSHVLIEAENDQLTVSGTDYNQLYSEKIMSDIKEPGKTCINAHKLLAILKKTKTSEIVFSCDEIYLTIQLGKLKTKLPVVQANLFPCCELNSSYSIFSLFKKEYKEIFDKTFNFISDQEARKNLTGLFIQNQERTVRFMGADAYRIGDYHIDKASRYYEDSPFGLIFPKPCFKNSVKIFESEDRIDFYTDNDKRYIQIKTQSKEYQSRLIDAEYPNLDKLLQGRSKHAIVDSESLIESSDMMYTLTGKEPNSVMKCTFNDTFKMESRKLELSESNCEIDCNFDSEETVIGLNMNFFQEIAKVFKKENNVKLSFEDCNSPFLMSSDTVDNYKAALLPVRLRW